MKLLLINPWGINNDGYYTRGFIEGLRDKTDITFATHCDSELSFGDTVNIKKIFFPRSDKMKRGKARKLLRGIEYIAAYNKLISMVKKERFDIIHIHWLLFYSLDIHFLRQLKKHVNKIVLTAHNVLPHRDGEAYIERLRPIYGLVDTILVHGEAIKEEFRSYFPEHADKVKIQYHGVYFEQDTAFDKNKVDKTITDRVESADSLYVMIGMQFYNKGTDRLIRSWAKVTEDVPGKLLIVAGRRDNEYKELDELRPLTDGTGNIMHFDYFIDNNTANYLMSSSDCIILPYRHASMSGVVFTAAEFEKTVLCTKTGVLNEYLEDGEDSILCENNDDALEKAIYRITHDYSREQFRAMGKKLKENINKKYSWNRIGSDLLVNVYERQN